MEKQANLLINASSPYLLQHAYNPVQWQEWGPQALQQAKDQNKLILVSIGYSACHWCHVMEHESFEDHEVAEVMNQNFVCIKIDREERPDIDHVYMLAVQLMGLNGGWPLNCICLPDQRPIYGGTYFRKSDWINILENVAEYWKKEPENAIAYAERLTQGIDQAEKIFPGAVKEYTKEDLTKILEPWKRTFDMVEGGYNRSPKFPLPNNWVFLLRAGYIQEDEGITTAVLHTLEKMALGGIYDQLGGGFSRYSVDDKWHVPHFEKMLYDNAQLIRLYAEAWQFTKFDLFKEVTKDCITWVVREMRSADGLFYSALDADSEGVEGKFYVWDKIEFDAVLDEDAALFGKYYNVSDTGNWVEEHTNILLRKQDDGDFATQFNIDINAFREKKNKAVRKLMEARNRRVRPGLDDKCLTAWNGMMITALAEAARILDQPNYYDIAKRAGEMLLTRLKMSSGGLYRNFKNGKPTIPGFLDDHAFTIEACLALYQYDLNEHWLKEATALTDHVLEYFSSDESPMFYYTAKDGEQLISRKQEVMDNVIPSANSVMAQNLHMLGLLYAKETYTGKAAEMLASVQSTIHKYGSAYSNWAIQLLNEVAGINEIAISGAEHQEVMKELSTFYIPNKVLLGGTKSTLPLLENKQGKETKIYICRNKTCSLPVDTVSEAINLIK